MKCGVCGHSGFVTDEAEQIANLIEALAEYRFPCRECDGNYERDLGEEPPKPVSFVVTAAEFWHFSIGQPSEAPHSVDGVIQKMKGQVIADVEGKMEGDRVVIDKLVLGNGTVLWLGFLRQEQVVYRVKEGQHDSESSGSES